ncbi:hypothetical protein CIW83_06295 [Tissierella sp. P1]|uniref:hypothetical protein n=1 Tax=Tissierella TaxID=41273 RepID=UPI000BA04336|nr:hypothetical protein [Tissierella sp. P1]OZV12828.1 hypothetical protein CIW83_06295 [Tissierella sp. P1]
MLGKILKIFGYFIVMISIVAAVSSIINKDFALLVFQVLALFAGIFLVYALKDTKIFKKPNTIEMDLSEEDKKII